LGRLKILKSKSLFIVITSSDLSNLEFNKALFNPIENTKLGSIISISIRLKIKSMQLTEQTMAK
jgi:hypothetical protein